LASISTLKFEAMRKRKEKSKTGATRSSPIEGKNYELINRNESGHRRSDGLRRIDRGRYDPGIAEAAPRRTTGSNLWFFSQLDVLAALSATRSPPHSSFSQLIPKGNALTTILSLL
jgi:hypothetical protein